MTLALIDRMYELHERLGEGGMGTVYRATHRLSGRTVALKLVRGALVAPGAEAGPDAGLRSCHDTQSRLPLAREFQVMASLHHPHIVKVLDFGFDERHGPYLAMELLPAPLTLLEAGADASHETKLDWLAQLLRALVYLHRRGVIHRDIKPSNAATERTRTSNDPQRFEVLANYGFGSGSIFGSLGELARLEKAHDRSHIIKRTARP